MVLPTPAKIFSRRWRARDVMMPLISRRRIKGVHIAMKPKTSAPMLRAARPPDQPPAISQAAFFLRPSDKCLRFGGNALAFTAYGKVFAKIKPRLQFGDCGLSFLDFLNIGMIQQPVCQALLANVSARGCISTGTGCLRPECPDPRHINAAGL